MASAPPTRSSAPPNRSPQQPGTAALGLAALGIVFGDIGTSPLYTLKTVLGITGGQAVPATALGILSLIIWTLIIITSVKYVVFAMSIDNDGEGGILALMALIGIKQHQRPAIVAFGLFGAALIYGDGAITPAISVLSALEGLDIAAPALKDFVLPAAVVILVALFAFQPQGTARIGKTFGPIMLLWFISIGALGLWGVVKHPGVFVALDPSYGLRYLFSNGYESFLALGGVFLCVTGAEALYADMGHFGRLPIRLAWSVVVFPALILNYAGQTALVLDGAPSGDNIFYRLCPEPLLVPLICLSAVATVIASQSIITGAFSMTRQAIQLGWLPRLRITQTSQEGYGQIYVGAVNWLLMLVTVGLTLGFRKSDNLAAAYGIAVSLTMLMTSALLGIAMREIWGWSVALSVAVTAAFLCVDGSFFAANLAKVLEGGYVPLLLAAAVYLVMYVWHRGSSAVAESIDATLTPIDDFLKSIETRKIPRVPGSAVFLTRTRRDTPPVMDWHVKHNRALHEHILIVTVTTESVPWIPAATRLQFVMSAPNFWRVVARYGFMERPDIPKLLGEAKQEGCDLDLADVTYYVGHATVVAREDGKGLPAWETSLYTAMERNSVHWPDFLRLPGNGVVEIGRQVAI